MQIGLYIHIPFCAAKCFYCDFLSFAREDQQEAYVEALIKEIEMTKLDLAQDATVKSIFIGGGTPTVLPPFLLEKIAEAIVTHFCLEVDAEWTIEANPGTLDEEKIKVLSTYPITRISLGLQSTHDELLKELGRIHTFKEFDESIHLIRKWTNWQINADLMFALPHQTEEAFRQTLETIVEYDLEHLSIYALIIEEGTRFWEFYESGKLVQASEEVDRSMYHYAQTFLEEKGYHQYEISNWAKAGCECKHNRIYWQTEPYLGLGLGAHSLFNHKRYYNEEKMQKYIVAQGNLDVLRYEEENLTPELEMQEYMFLGLRLLEGIEISDFKQRFGVELWEIYGKTLDKWIKYKILSQDKGRVYLTPYGMDVCNEVFASFL